PEYSCVGDPSVQQNNLKAHSMVNNSSSAMQIDLTSSDDYHSQQRDLGVHPTIQITQKPLYSATQTSENNIPRLVPGGQPWISRRYDQLNVSNRINKPTPISRYPQNSAASISRTIPDQYLVDQPCLHNGSNQESIHQLAHGQVNSDASNKNMINNTNALNCNPSPHRHSPSIDVNSTESRVTHHPPSPSNSRDQSTMIRDRHQPPMPPHRTKISILGDSMIKRVQSRQIRRAVSTSKSVYIRSFPGSKSLDMTDFARPTMRDNPDHIIIHIGTNDVRQSNPEDVIRNVENLCNQIKDQCPRTTISLSELIVRNDFPDATTKISKINNELLCLSRSKGYYLINNSNISVQNLDRYGLHLNETHLNPTWSDSEVSIDGYHCVRRDRTTSKGGGLIVYIPYALNFNIRSDIQVSDEYYEIEYLWIEFLFQNSKSILVNFL
ncbi:Furin, partial, partial [Paramuricea clavata]